MVVIIGSDHGAFEAKESLKESLNGHEIIDAGPDSADSCHYPEYAVALVREVIKRDTIGIILCGSGIGVSMVANRYAGIRAALVRTTEEARLSREHNNSNVLCLGGRISSEDEIKEIVKTWINTPFEGGRHSIRLSMFENLGEKMD